VLVDCSDGFDSGDVDLSNVRVVGGGGWVQL
jgi:hypothetical protein